MKIAVKTQKTEYIEITSNSRPIMPHMTWQTYNYFTAIIPIDYIKGDIHFLNSIP